MTVTFYCRRFCLPVVPLLVVLSVAGSVAQQDGNAFTLQSGGVLQVYSPVHGASYEVSDDDLAVPARVYLNLTNEVGGSALVNKIARRPQDWHLCVTWDLAKHSALRQSGNHPGVFDDEMTGVYCQNFPLADDSMLPPLLRADVEEGGASDGRQRIFSTWIGRADIVIYRVDVPYTLVEKRAPEAGEPVASEVEALPQATAMKEVKRRAAPGCLVGALITGTMRTFVSQAVRRRFIAAMRAVTHVTTATTLPSSAPQARCDVELLAHVSIPYEGAVPWADKQVARNKPIPPFEANLLQVEETIRDLNETLLLQLQLQQLSHRQQYDVNGDMRRTGTVRLADVLWFDEAAHHQVPNRCPSGLPPKESYPQLYKMAHAFHFMLLPQERRLGRRYSWVLRLRWDLAWLRPPPPLSALSREVVSLSYQFWPISDQFAIVPRRLADEYFNSVDDFYACAEDRGDERLFTKGQVSSESVLFRHMNHRKVPYKFIEVNAPIARSRNPHDWCRVRKTMLIPCNIISALNWTSWSTECLHLIDEHDDGGPKLSDLLRRQCEDDFANVSMELGLETEAAPVQRNSGQGMTVPKLPKHAEQFGGPQGHGKGEHAASYPIDIPLNYLDEVHESGTVLTVRRGCRTRRRTGVGGCLTSFLIHKALACSWHRVSSPQITYRSHRPPAHRSAPCGS